MAKDKSKAQLQTQVNQLTNTLSAEKEKTTSLTNEVIAMRKQVKTSQTHAKACEDRANKILREAHDVDRMIAANVGGSHQVVSKTDRKIRGVLEPVGTVIGFVTPAGHYTPQQVADAVCRGSGVIKPSIKEKEYLNQTKSNEKITGLQKKVDEQGEELEAARQTVDSANAHCADLENAIEDLKTEIASLKEAAGKGDPEEQDAGENSENKIED